jgi:hypothetical protein
VKNPICYAVNVADSCFENAIRYSLSRRFDAAHLFKTEEETDRNVSHDSVCEGPEEVRLTKEFFGLWPDETFVIRRAYASIPAGDEGFSRQLDGV